MLEWKERICTHLHSHVINALPKKRKQFCLSPDRTMQNLLAWSGPKLCHHHLEEGTTWSQAKACPWQWHFTKPSEGVPRQIVPSRKMATGRPCPPAAASAFSSCSYFYFLSWTCSWPPLISCSASGPSLYNLTQWHCHLLMMELTWGLWSWARALFGVTRPSLLTPNQPCHLPPKKDERENSIQHRL